MAQNWKIYFQLLFESVHCSLIWCKYHSVPQYIIWFKIRAFRVRICLKKSSVKWREQLLRMRSRRMSVCVSLHTAGWQNKLWSGAAEATCARTHIHTGKEKTNTHMQRYSEKYYRSSEIQMLSSFFLCQGLSAKLLHCNFIHTNNAIPKTLIIMRSCRHINMFAVWRLLHLSFYTFYNNKGIIATSIWQNEGKRAFMILRIPSDNDLQLVILVPFLPLICEHEQIHANT